MRQNNSSAFLARKYYNCSSLLYGIIKSDLGAAYGRSVGLVVIDHAVFTVIYHFIVALNVGGATCAVELFGIIGFVVVS